MGIGGQRKALAALPLGKTDDPHFKNDWMCLGTGLESFRTSRRYRASNPGPSSLHTLAVHVCAYVKYVDGF